MKNNNCGFSLLNFLGVCPRNPCMAWGLQIKVLSFHDKKPSIFHKISHAGMPPDLPSMTRGLQINVLSLNGKKGSKVHNF